MGKKLLKPKFLRNRLAFFAAMSALAVSFAVGFSGAIPLQQAQAAAVKVEPLILDHQGLPRDIIKGSFKITNPNPHKVNVFTTTKNFDPSKGEQKFIEPATADFSSSLANWISVSTKMIEMEPNQSVTVDYEIDINLRAEEGAYHAIMFFHQGSSRSEAEQQVANAPRITVNLTVGDDSKERLQVARFKGPGTVLGFKAGFEVEVNNTGNATLKPKGEVRIYNRNGEEVATIPLNEEGEEVQPGGQKLFQGIWKARGFGRYKAQIVLEFGDKQFQTYQDSVFFWLLPWPILLCLIMILTGIVLLLLYTLHRAHTHRLRQQEQYYEQVMKQKIQQAKRNTAKKLEKQNPNKQ